MLFGSADGWVYCLRAADGALAWRFLAAPCERRIVCFDQLESAWPVHGSVLVREGVAYVAAGRSTYLDGGIRLYALETQTGRILHQTTLSGPFPDGQAVKRDVAFFIRGANSDVLVERGRRDLHAAEAADAGAAGGAGGGVVEQGRGGRGAARVLDGGAAGRFLVQPHLLDVREALARFPARQPGAEERPIAGRGQGEHLRRERVLPPQRAHHDVLSRPGGLPAVRRQEQHRTANRRRAGARPPVAWLPQSDYQASNGLRRLDSPAFGVDKGTGYTRAEPPLWTLWLPVRIRAMVKAGDTLFVAGPPDELDAGDPYASFEGRKGARLVAVSAKDGKQLAERELDVPPVFDGLIAVNGRLLIALEDGSLACFAARPE